MNAVSVQPLTRLPELPGAAPPLPAPAELAAVLPAAGLRRGSATAVHPAPGGSAVVLALLAAASASGAWCAVVGWPELGGMAAVELGAVPERLVAIPSPGDSWPVVVAALLDGAELVVLRPTGTVDPRVAHRLTTRLRERRATLLVAGEWPGAELLLTATGSRWLGVERGAGHLTGRELRVQVRGRGAASRPRQVTLRLPPAPPPDSPPLDTPQPDTPQPDAPQPRPEHRHPRPARLARPVGSVA